LKEFHEDMTALGCLNRYIKEFHEDMAALGCLPPSEEPKATDYVPQMVRTIQSIMDKGHAYEADGDVLFAVESIDGYGRLSGRSLVPPFLHINLQS
jgi:cysteinyl-tRNA synthetase